MTEPAAAFDTLQDRRVFVTGATGVVGGWLVRSMLNEGADVVALVRDEPANCEFIRSGDWERVTRVRGDLTDDRLIARALLDYEVEILFHLGAQSQVGLAVVDPFGTMESNVRGTYTVLEAARATSHLKALVIASSDKAYGASSELPYRESHPLAGRGIYDASKSAADTIATAYALSFGLPLLIARCGNIYGGGDLNWERLIPGTIRSLLLGQRPIIRSNGRPRRDYVFVDDAVGAYRTLAIAGLSGKHHGEAFNFGLGQPVTVDDVVQELMRQTGRTDLAPVILDQAKGEIPDQFLDASKASEQLGWRPSFSLADGLQRTIDWYRELLTA